MEVVTGVASSVVAKILEYPVRLIGRHLGYLIYYQTNKKCLTDREPELDDKIRSVQRRAQAARRSGEEIEECVTRWISEAESKAQEAKDVIDDLDRGHENAKCSCNGSFPNLVSRYKLSKKAKIMAEKIVIDLQKADNFGNFSYRPLIQPSFKNKDYEAFDTRNQTLKEIMEALRDPNPAMIGVYGMGGIGKTTLVEEVAHQAKEEKCFSDVVMVTVSQVFDLKSIQNRIAEGLGLTLDGENMSVRAKRLQDRSRQGNKTLIILDDIWNKLDLREAGIPFNADDQKGCKILLVSRDRDVLCNLMGVTKIIEVKVLSDSEAKGLFDKFVGDIDDNSEFKELANQVVGECGGLPIAIVTIACSLKNKDIFVWKDFLSRLKSSRGMEGKVYSSIKMSYDVLQSEEKKFLLLCSLHGEDANVCVNDLKFYGIGLDLFREVHLMVDKLKAHCLLLDGDDEGFVKMHDVIRDVMISIAKEDEHMHCLTKVADLEDGDFRESKAIMLLGPDFNYQILPSLVCPKLQLLLASDSNDYLSIGSMPDDFFIPDEFFKEAQELKALSFDRGPLESLPQSFRTLRHLRALRLRLGEEADLTLIGELMNLIALDLSGSYFSQLPEHIGKLTRLRSLNLSKCESLRVIQPNVISSLVRLEELYMDEVYIDWEVEGRMGRGRNASLVEFKNLRNLTALHLNVNVTNADVLSKNIFSKNLQRFRIRIGSCSTYTGQFTCSLDVSNCPNLKNLFTVAMAVRLAQLERLKIHGCPDMEEVVVTNEQGEGRLEKILFPKLKSLELKDLPNLKKFCTGDCIECPSLLELIIEDCGALRMFISSNEEEVEGPFFNEKVAFPKLEKLNIWGLDSVNSLFSFVVAKSLVTLEKLHVSDCNLMEEIVQVKEQGRLDKISFPKLKYIAFDDLSNLKRFYEKSEELMGSEAKQPLFNGTVAFPKLEELYVDGLNSVDSLFSFAFAKSLVTLEELRVWSCSLMEEIVQVKEQEEEERLGKISFPKLESIDFDGLPNLKRFYGGACIEFPSLLKLEITADKETEEIMDKVVLGPNLEELRTSSSKLIKEMCNCQSSRAPPFCNLKDVDLECFRNEPIGFSLKCIQRYQNLESLYLSGFFVDTTHHHQQLTVSLEERERPLKHLKKLRLSQLSMLTHLYEDSEDSENSSLESLKFLRIQECSRLKSPLLSSTTSFQNLMALVVSKCSAMINLLASSTAKTLVHLRLMSIIECKQMTEIIADESVDDEIVFGNLEILELSDLPSLGSFHSAGNSVMRFPNLVMLVVNQCPEMRRFSSGTIDAPKLDSIISKIEKFKNGWNNLDDERYFEVRRLMNLWSEPQRKLWEGDINKTLEKLWEEDSLVMQRMFTET